MSIEITAPSWALIDLDAYRHNLRAIRGFIPRETRLLVSVKANAYGHGMISIARAALAEGVDMLGVATVAEGAELRAAGIDAPVLLLFQPAPDGLSGIVEHQLEASLSDIETARALGRLASSAGYMARVHAHVDTGMGRQGINHAAAIDTIEAMLAVPGLEVVGLSTHFPQADLADDLFTQLQIMSLKDLIHALRERGIQFHSVHASNSPGVVNYPDAAFDMVRPGVMTFGVWPCADSPHRPLLHPVIQWETRITQIRDLLPGESVSYHRTYVAAESRRVAILPVGYADGYRVAFSNRAEVLVRGVRCPVRGRVCMDQTVVDITNVPNAKVGDKVVLLGRDVDVLITADELASHAETIAYEILTGVGSRVQRVPVEAAAR